MVRVSRAGEGGQTPPVILVAEDEEPIRRVAMRALERSGYTVIAAKDGREALDRLLGPESVIDLVVADFGMPEMNGSELRDTASSRGVTPPFLFTSGYGLEVVRGSMDVAAAVAFLPKPWTLAQLVAKVREVLADHAADEPGPRGHVA